MSLPRSAMWRMEPSPSDTTWAWKPLGSTSPSGSAAKAGMAVSSSAAVKIVFMEFPLCLRGP